ncbi:MAG: phosphatidylserine/phosphatidylglycerophosphate/cardiolipin synthase family protein [Candidatus Pacearchaeota archaeon]
MRTFEVLSRPGRIYRRMLGDIKNAEKSIYLETYIFDKDKVGNIFRKALEKKAAEGVKIRVLVDAWGSTADKKFFGRLVCLGGEVRFFKEFKYAVRIFAKNHERDHRKLLIIDRKITFVGSVNITASCLKWRELVLRLDGDISENFARSFNRFWNRKGKVDMKRINKIAYRGFEIIQDIPSTLFNPTEISYEHLINNAKKTILIETPYFVPSLGIRQALKDAAQRGVEVKIAVPKISNVKSVNIIREAYLGELWRCGAYIYYFNKFTHSKLMVIDNNYFILGSSNMDYRSFRHQYDINLLGKDKKIIAVLKRYFDRTIFDCVLFDYKKWSSRSLSQKIGGFILKSVRRYL